MGASGFATVAGCASVINDPVASAPVASAFVSTQADSSATVATADRKRNARKDFTAHLAHANPRDIQPLPLTFPKS
jgi:hypothetical protein